MQITVNTKTLSIDLSADLVESVVSGLPDTEEYQEFYSALAMHPSSGVRAQVAYKDHITAETVVLLARDVSPEVRRHAVRSKAGRTHLTEEMLRSLANNDIECAETIAGSMGEYEQVESESLAEMFAAHSDPKVRRAAASNSSTPKRLLKKLARDADANVRRDATYALAC